MADPDDEDYFPNDFDGLDFDNVPGLQVPTTDAHTSRVASTSRSNEPPTVAGPTPSPESDNVEDTGLAFLAAVDALEAHALSKTSRGSQSLTCTEPDGLPTGSNKDATGLRSAQEYSKLSVELSATDRKGKGKAESQGDLSIRAALAGYEAELTCPICCDLLVGAQVTNPCGHTCCGVCIHEWLQRNKYEPTCAVCRSRLSTRKPLLPNFSVDSLVHQHLQILAKSGRPEWQEKGYKTVEWNKRLRSWKEQVAARAAKEKLKDGARLRRRRARHYEIADYSYAASWSTDESIVDEGAMVVHVTPRRVRARR